MPSENSGACTDLRDRSIIISLISSFSLPFSTRYNPLIVECLLVFKVQSASKLLPRSYLTSHANKVAFVSEINLFVFWGMSHDLSQNALTWSHASGSDPQNVNYSPGWLSYLWAETALGQPCWVWGWTGTVCLVGDTGPAAAPLDSLWEWMDPSLLLHHCFHHPECGSS